MVYIAPLYCKNIAETSINIFKIFNSCEVLDQYDSQPKYMVGILGKLS